MFPVRPQFEADGGSGQLLTEAVWVGLDESSLFDEPPHEVSEAPVDGGSRHLQPFVEVFLQIVPHSDSGFLLLRV